MSHLRLVGGPDWPDDIGTALDFIEKEMRAPILPPRLYLTERQAADLRAAGWPAEGDIPPGETVVVLPEWGPVQDAELDALAAELRDRMAGEVPPGCSCMDFLRAGQILRDVP